ncbi:MAG: FkbM family methyltransferase [Stenomitos rutilans HA7619-LM2]|jgi:FkbM family methyltransferase|nr:FkbM family methyltransferase [Stenomitos rutilans HA7619-LM2]
MNTSPYTKLYWQYLQGICPSIAPASLPTIQVALEATNWEEPQSPLEWNNYGVLALIEAEQATDLDLRRLYVETAIDAFNQGANAHPLCAAHLALTYSLVGETQISGQIALANFVQIVQPLYTRSESLAPGLIYLPLSHFHETLSPRLIPVVQQEDGLHQALLLLGDVLSYQLQTVFYNEVGQRFLHLAVHMTPMSVINNLLLGISGCMNEKWESLLHLHRAQQLAPDHPKILQALYLAYRDRQQAASANMWLETAQTRCLETTNPDHVQWTTLANDCPFTYVAFDTILLAVRASLLTITTGVLLAKGDWFEAEMEFWRNQIQPGMTVIDVGANVGVYAFSAARRVGETGRVLAVEPFLDCVQCLQQTCAINQFHWVNVIAGAASDRNHTARLAINPASELNRLIEADGDLDIEQTETVSCFTLDYLVEQAAITHVDFLKIDVEGHELQVLTGSEKILTEYMPTILYENIGFGEAANLDAAEFLQAKGYLLFYYVPYVQTLSRLETLSTLQNSLNIIAVHASKAGL